MIEAAFAIAVVVLVGGSGAALAWIADRRAPRTETGIEPLAGLDLDLTSPVRAAVVAFSLFSFAGSLVLIIAGESRGAGPGLAAGALGALGIGAYAAGRRLGPLPLVPRPQASPVGWLAIAAMAGVGLVALGWLVSRHGIPLLATDPQASRAGFSGIVFDLFRWLVPPAALVAFSAGMASDSRRRIVLGLAALGVVGTLEVLLASRALPFELAIGTGLIAWWAGIRPGRRIWLGAATAGLVLFVGIQFVRVAPEGGFTGVPDAAAFAVRRTVDRVAFIHPRTLELVATKIPAEEPFFGGSTYVRRIAVFFGVEERPSLGYWIYERMFPGQPGGFAAPGVAGEAWANGGPVLVLVVMAFVGALAAALGRTIRRLPGGPADQALAAVVIVAVARSYATSLNGLVLSLLMAGGWWLLASGRVGRRFRRGTGNPPSGP